MRTCPEDRSRLERRTLHGLDLDVCPTCAGIYFDEGEIAALQANGPSALVEVEDAAVPSDLAPAKGRPGKRCPSCEELMTGYTYRYSSTIGLDGCARCGGVWIQDGELAQIAGHLRTAPQTHGGTPRARRAAEGENAAVRHARVLHAYVRLLPEPS